MLTKQESIKLLSSSFKEFDEKKVLKYIDKINNMSEEEWEQFQEEKNINNIQDLESLTQNYIIKKEDKEISIKINLSEIESLEKIGSGKCANIYRKDNEAYKILKQRSDSRKFYSKEMLEKLVGVKSDLCVFPNKILEDDNGELLGYSMDFVTGDKLIKAIKEIPFEQLKTSIKKAELGVSQVSEQGFRFNDMHADNIMWDTKNKSIKIIDTDFFQKSSDISDIANSNFRTFDSEIQMMIASLISSYGETVNDELIPFYNLSDFKYKDGRKLSLEDYILNLKESLEKEFKAKFNNIGEILESLKERQEKIEDRHHREYIENNLNIKERIIRRIAQSAQLRKLPFVDKFINRKIKMLPSDIREIMIQPKVIEEKQVANRETFFKRKRRVFVEKLRNNTSNADNIFPDSKVNQQRTEENEIDFY